MPLIDKLRPTPLEKQTLSPRRGLGGNGSYSMLTEASTRREMREYFIPDLSGWKDRGSYQRAFQRLVEDLTAAESK